MKNAFTLIELLIVITIIAVLAGAMVPLFRTSRKDAGITKAWNDMEAVRTASQLFHLDTGIWPSMGFNCMMFDALVKNRDADGKSIPGWDGPYLDEFTGMDPWGNSYGEWWPPDNRSFWITCTGPDGIIDSADDFELLIANY